MGRAGRARIGSQARTAATAGPTAKTGSARQKLADRRVGDRRADVRKRLLLAGGAIAVVIAVVATLIAVQPAHPAQPHARSAPAAGAGAAAQVQQQVTSVPAAVFNTVGAGTATGLSTVTGQAPLTTGGKPEMLYIGGEFCPFCAAQRWALAAAVSRFGTLSGVSFIHSSPTDTDANTPTLSFAKATYTSKYLAFVPVEWYGEATDPSTPFGHVYLQQPTAEQQVLFGRYGNGAIPFVDIGNRYILPQVQYDPAALAGLNWAQVAAAMRDPSSAIAKDIDGGANILTAAICALTNGQPGDVCQSAGVKAASGSI